MLDQLTNPMATVVEQERAQYGDVVKNTAKLSGSGKIQFLLFTRIVSSLVSFVGYLGSL